MLYMLSQAKYRTLLSGSLKEANTGGTIVPKCSAIFGPSAILSSEVHDYYQSLRQ